MSIGVVAFEKSVFGVFSCAITWRLEREVTLFRLFRYSVWWSIVRVVPSLAKLERVV